MKPKIEESRKGTNSFYVKIRKRTSSFLKIETGPWNESLLILKE